MAAPEYAGFVFAKSRRQVTIKRAEEMRKVLSPEIEAVGVFVNEEIQVVAEICNRNIIQLIQLHGEESKEYVEQLRKLVDVPIIKAVRVRGVDDIKSALELVPTYLLVDSFLEGVYGGTGKPFDVTLLPEMSQSFFLAGGLHEGNVEELVRKVHPYCVDVSSGVETDGRKDYEKIVRFISTVRNIGGI